MTPRALLLIRSGSPVCLSCVNLESLLTERGVDLKVLNSSTDKGRMFLCDVMALAAYYDVEFDDTLPVALIQGWTE